MPPITGWSVRWAGRVLVGGRTLGLALAVVIPPLSGPFMRRLRSGLGARWSERVRLLWGGAVGGPGGAPLPSGT
eukprot:scaffold92059_cov39-Phaeocystis_antarctica.AAC.1